MTATYKLLIHGLSIFAKVGIHPHERHKPQQLLIRLEMECEEPLDPGQTEQVVCYKTVVTKFRRLIAKNEPFGLLEQLADALAEKVMEEKRVKALTLRLTKPQILSGVRAVGVEITRRR